ncbi:hypothetical protein [Tenacibaculum sp. 190524A05c]|uniref:hypothetical protein n=1 Tax=Tenacibaculum platacis TaxID=3137852 RepID=UPI0032B1C0B9
MSFRTLEMKLANGGIISKNEASFQLELGYILKVFGQLYEFHPNEKFNLEMENYIKLKSTSIKSNSKNARVDILVTFGTENEFAIGAIELKYFKKKNHREPNNRYDIFKDISNLEAYKENGIDLNYLFISTDHNHYVNQSEYSEDTKDFDIRKGSKYKSGQVLEYRTAKPYGPPIALKGNYEFNWSEPTENIYFTTIEI